MPVKPIRDINVGDRVLSDSENDAKVKSISNQPEQVRRIVLEMDKVDGSRLSIELLRTENWLRQANAEVGRTIELSLPDQGAQGRARVLEILPGPTLIPADGDLVTGVFKHTADNIVELVIESGDEPVRCTANHPFWSQGQQRFMAADQLEIGDYLHTSSGNQRLLKRTRLSGSYPVFNIEVEGSHTYLVSSDGILVHNSCGLRPPTRFITGPDGTTVDLKPTLDRIAQGIPHPHRNDGTTFRNDQGRLPPKAPGYYTEYVHPTPGVPHAGKQRIVTGKGGEYYYTPNHYITFIPLN